MPILYYNYTDEVRVCQKCIHLVKAGNEKFCLPEGDVPLGAEPDSSVKQKQGEILSFRHSAASSPATRRSQSERMVSPSIIALANEFSSQQGSQQPFFLSSPSPIAPTNSTENQENLSKADENGAIFALETTVETNSASLL